MKIGWVLGSGGARGISHIGFLQALEDNNIPIDIITGCSIGSVVGAVYLSGYTPKQMFKIAQSLKKSDLIELSITMFSSRAFIRPHKMESILKELLGEKTFADLKKPFACTAVNIVDGETYTFTDGPLWLAARASSSIPLVFPPVKKGQMQLVDGGINDRIPVAQAKELGADKVIAIDICGEVPPFSDNNNLISLAMRMVDLMSYNVGKHRAEVDRPDLLIVPPFGKISQYKIENQQKCYDIGYTQAMKYMNKIKEICFSDNEQ